MGHGFPNTSKVRSDHPREKGRETLEFRDQGGYKKPTK